MNARPRLVTAGDARAGQPSATAPVLSPEQAEIVALGAGSGPVLVLGGPGTGKSTVLVEAAVRRIDQDGLDPASVLMLAPSRLSAARLRDALTSRLNRSLSAAPARTWASYAFDLIRRARIEGRIPELIRSPRLLSGAEQDLIIKELLDGHNRPGATPLGWPEGLTLALPTRGFRQEVRELFDRVSEYGMHPDELADLGRRFNRPDWTAGAQLYQEYRDILDLRMPEAFDPAGVLTAARNLLEVDAELLAQERSRLQLILVDDYQESNAAVHALFTLLGRDSDVLVASCPDTVVHGFRGARPELTGRLAQDLTGNTKLLTVALRTSHRLTGPLAEAWQNVASRISVVGGAGAYRTLEPAPQGPTILNEVGLVSAHLVDSSFHELRYVAQRILEAQLFAGRSLGDIAVIVRTGAQLAEFQRYLTGQGIAVNVPAAERAIRDEPAVKPLLDIFGVVLGQVTLDAALAVSLLSSRVGGAGTLELRRLRQSLRQTEVAAGRGRTSDELLVEALTDPSLIGPGMQGGKAARRVARMISAGTSALEAEGANPETVLWALWEASGWSTQWADSAVAEGASAAHADRDLDAVVALFQTAERFVDQVPGAAPARFLEYLTSQELPMDTLAPRAQNQESVALLTPASASGREWPVVIVAGIQEGTWPNLRLRGELLGSGELTALMDYGADFRRHRDPLILMQEIRFDELRSFSVAVSRATEELICCAVASDEAQPSPFLDLVDPLPPGQLERSRTEVQRPLTLRALVAELRKYAQQATAYPELSREATHHLGAMVNHSPTVPGAHPREWWGLQELSSSAPVVPGDQPIPVSPSKVDAVLKSPLNWFVSAVGGEPTMDFARSLGTLVHSIAQDFPDATGSQYVEELQRRWPSLGMKENWEGRIDFQRAEQMVRKLAGYVIAMRQAGRSLVGTEVDFEVDLEVAIGDAPRVARLRGQIDRLEIDAEGRLVIVDLKTGKSSPSLADLDRHPQLASYQVAVNEGALSAGQVAGSGGAALVQLGTTRKEAGVQQQPALAADDGWAREMIEEAARLMSSAQFDTVHDPKRSGHGGSGCRLPEICPLCQEGRQVTE
ncbi:ATP-dependent helicase [Arthrobacter sp. CAL618]|uniref:ATP-dependent helicase n=1 Tax=Arthrobacter sp. CAL618 TaxID=1055770 RepID=UPI0005599F37|nr:ATP-dependent DNA helicase [Arthrobacter sp. CAL618]